MTIEESRLRERSPVEAERAKGKKVYMPAVDIIQKKDATILIADMAGVDEKSVNISLEKNILTIQGVAAQQPREGYDLVYSEYDIGDYQRSFSISDEVDQDRIKATVKDGVLRLTLPKAERVKAKKIVVKAE